MTPDRRSWALLRLGLRLFGSDWVTAMTAVLLAWDVVIGVLRGMWPTAALGAVGLCLGWRLQFLAGGGIAAHMALHAQVYGELEEFVQGCPPGTMRVFTSADPEHGYGVDRRGAVTLLAESASAESPCGERQCGYSMDPVLRVVRYIPSVRVAPPPPPVAPGARAALRRRLQERLHAASQPDPQALRALVAAMRTAPAYEDFTEPVAV